MRTTLHDHGAVKLAERTFPLWIGMSLLCYCSTPQRLGDRVAGSTVVPVSHP